MDAKQAASSPPPTLTPVTCQILSPTTKTKPVEFDLMLPYGSGSYDTLAAIEDEFGGAGVAFPYKLLIVDTAPPANDRWVGGGW